MDRHYLVEQSEYLTVATRSELKMEVEATDAIINDDPPILGALYMLYVVAPKLGNFRRKILTVIEGAKAGRFPVDVVNHFDNKESMPIKNVEEKDFIEVVKKILSGPLVKNSIENLYTKSKEYTPIRTQSSHK